MAAEAIGGVMIWKRKMRVVEEWSLGFVMGVRLNDSRDVTCFVDERKQVLVSGEGRPGLGYLLPKSRQSQGKHSVDHWHSDQLWVS